MNDEIYFGQFTDMRVTFYARHLKVQDICELWEEWMGNLWTSFIHYLSQVLCLGCLEICTQGLIVLWDAAAATGPLNQWSRICSYWASTAWKGKKNGFVCLFFSFLKICYSNLSMIHAIQVFFPLGFFSFPHTHDSVKPNLLSYSSENLFL